MQYCKRCRSQKNESDFGYRNNEQLYRQCQKCRIKTNLKDSHYRPVVRAKDRYQRLNNIRVEHYIYQESRKSDKKRGMENNLTKEYILSSIAEGCCYCGETELRMTMDRIDNTIGHLMANCVPACIRCNYARGNMPYKAWLILCPGIRQARECGAFGSWTGRARCVDVNRQIGVDTRSALGS